MRRSRNTFFVRLVTAVTLVVSLLGTLVTAPQVAFAAPNGSDIDVKWYGAAPGTYDQADGSGGDSSNVVTALQGGDFACGDHVVFFAVVEISDTATAGASTGVFNFNLGWETTNGTQIGFRVLNSITLATTDSQWAADNDNSTITAFSATPTPAVNPDNLVVSATISDLEPGETIVIKIDAGIVCAEDGTGNLPTSWGGGTVIAGGEGTIGGGAQTITMKVDGIVLYDPVIVTMVSEPETQPGVGVTDTAIVSGPVGVPAPAGTVTFFACGPTASPQDCTTGGTQVGSPVTLVTNQAVSALFAPTVEGSYCFRAEYTPDEGTPYNAGSHTNSTTECFSVVVPRGNIIVEKQTVPDGSPQSFTFTPSWGIPFNLTDGQSNDSGLLPAGTYSVAETVPDGWDMNAVCSDGSPVNAIDLAGGETVTCTFTNTQRQDLTVTKTATASYDRTYNWTIDKTVDQDPPSQTIASGSATFGYNVAVNQTGYTDSGWTLSGTITVANPNSFAVTGVTVSDSYPGGSCVVTGGAGVTVPAATNGVPGSVTLNYSCTFASQPAYSATNTATASWDNATWHLPSTSATGTAAVTFVRDQSINQTITVVDNKVDQNPPVQLGQLTATDQAPFASQTYQYDLALPGVAGECTSYTNTATISETEQSDTQTVRVCVVQAPTVTKTAVESYTTTYTWDITKSVDDDSQTVPAGSTATFNYSIAVEHDGGINSLYQVTGTISVTNPNDFAPMTGVVVTDNILGDTGDTCVVAAGPTTIAAGATQQYTYTCTWAGTPASTTTQTNQATVTWTPIDGETASASSEATVTWSEATVTLVDESITVTDSLEGVLGTATVGVGTFPKTFPYSQEFGGVSGTCTTYPNTATFTTNDTETTDSDSQTVTVCVGANLTVSKTATTAFVRTHTWAIDKTANPTELSLFAGGSAAVGYTVAVDKTTTDSAWVVAGQITVGNPNTWAVTLVDITDSIDNGGVCTVSGGTDVTVPAGGTVTRTYVCTFASNPGSGTNTATATWPAGTGDVPYPAGSANGTAAYNFGQAVITTVGHDAVSVTDTNGEAWGPVSADTSWTYNETLSCSSDPALYAGDGHYQFTHPNTATITATGQTATETVTVDCYAPQVSKTAQTSYTRTWAWQIDKSADVSTLSLDFWQPGTVNYQVTVSGTPVDSNWAVSGVITVANPNPDAAMTVALTDVVSGGIAATISADADCNYTAGTLTIPAGGTATCPYTAPLPDGTSRTNTATATLNQIAFSGSAPVTFGAPTNVVDETITVTDSQQGLLGTVTGTGSSATRTWTYQKQVGPYAACTILDIVNTATFVANDTQTSGSDTWTVDVVVKCEAVCDCTRLPSYWLSMADKGSRRGYDKTWDLIGPQGSATTFFQSPYSYKLVLLLRPSGSEGVYYTLAQQYIGAQLNILQGASAPQEVVDALTQSSAIFQQYTPAQVGAMSSGQKAELQSLANTLYRYNMGYIGPGRCR